MPLSTFFNLTNEKKERVFLAGLKEFSRVPLEEVSVKNIVNTANIPRGSFYQYFEDKEDFLRYLINVARQKRGAKSLLANKEKIESIFKLIYSVAQYELSCFDNNDLSERVMLINQISLSTRASTIFFEEIRHNALEDGLFDQVWSEHLSQLEAESQQEAVMELLFSATQDCIISVIRKKRDAEAALSLLKKKLDIIEAGIVKKA